jgi:hypothetical protein
MQRYTPSCINWLHPAGNQAEAKPEPARNMRKSGTPGFIGVSGYPVKISVSF